MTIRRLLCATLLVSPILAFATPRDVTFLATSDCHYVETERRNDRNASNKITIDAMNHLAELTWPTELGGDPVPSPRAVVVLGDCIDDGDKLVNRRNVSAEQYSFFVADFGLDGTDGRLKFPVFEGWGNHDGPPVGKEKNGFSFQAHLKQRNLARRDKGLISSISEAGVHYSWDWDDAHFVHLNLYPADRQREGVRYDPTWHDPQGALAFLKKDLAEKVGDSGRPVILMSHCGFDTDWWTPLDWRDLYDAAKSYNVVLYIYGHSGTGVRTWAPAGEAKKWQCINDGQTEKGFFVIQLIGDRLRAAMRMKSTYKVIKEPDGALHAEWDGQWEWHWVLDRTLDAPAPQQNAGK
jgi:cytolysin (calcineurin-like family phosphatase)